MAAHPTILPLALIGVLLFAATGGLPGCARSPATPEQPSPAPAAAPASEADRAHVRQSVEMFDEIEQRYVEAARAARSRDRDRAAATVNELTEDMRSTLAYARVEMERNALDLRTYPGLQAYSRAASDLRSFLATRDRAHLAAAEREHAAARAAVESLKRAAGL